MIEYLSQFTPDQLSTAFFALTFGQLAALAFFIWRIFKRMRTQRASNQTIIRVLPAGTDRPRLGAGGGVLSKRP